MDLIDRRLEQQLDALAAVELGEPAADQLAEQAGERQPLGLDDRHLGAGGAGGGGDLLADEAGADDQEASARREERPQPLRVLERAERADVPVAARTPAAGAAWRPVATTRCS